MGDSAGTGEVWERRRWLGVGLALLAGVALRLWFVGHAPRVSDDGLMYGDLAGNWLRHGVYGLTRGLAIRPTLIRLPGYPMFLAACFAVFGVGSFRAVMLVHVAIDLAACGLIAATAGRLFGQRAGLAALWLAALCPFTANYTATALTETWSIFCVALAFYGLVGWRQSGLKLDRWVWGIGVALAYAVLLRPEQGLLAAAAVPAMGWMVWRAGRGLAWKRFAPVILTALLTIAPLGPWAARNWRTFHVIQPLAPRNANDPGEPVPTGFQRWFRTWGVDYLSTEQVYWNYDNDLILATNLPTRAFDSPEQYGQTAALLEEYNRSTSASPEFNARFAALAAARVRAGWWRYYVGLPLARLGDMLLRPRTELLVVPLDWWRWRAHPRGSLLAIAFLVVNLGYFVLAGWGVRRCRGRLGGVGLAMSLFFVMRCAMLASIDNSEPRYTLEFFPLLFILGSCIFDRLP